MISFIDLLWHRDSIELLQRLGRIVFANDYDRKSSVVYLNNYKGSEEYYPGPISKWTQPRNFQVPEHNILVAGFPCQPFQ